VRLKQDSNPNRLHAPLPLPPWALRAPKPIATTTAQGHGLASRPHSIPRTTPPCRTTVTIRRTEAMEGKRAKDEMADPLSWKRSSSSSSTSTKGHHLYETGPAHPMEAAMPQARVLTTGSPLLDRKIRPQSASGTRTFKTQGFDDEDPGCGRKCEYERGRCYEHGAKEPH
jgi:hypothetical protein